MSGIGHLVFAIAMMQVFGAPGDKASTSTIRTPGSSWSGQRPASSDTIIFPDSKEKDEINLPPPPKIRITPCPNGQTFCDDDDNYPSHYLRKIPRQYFDPYNNFFLNDTLVPEGLSTRIDGFDEQPLCLSKEEVRFPKKAVATDGTLQIVVNDGFYMQGVRVELCLREGSACQFDEAFPQGYTTACKQKFIARKLVAISPGKNPVRPIAVKDFLIPSCCVCTVTPNSINSRIDRGSRPSH
uniref:Spaetzle domain-containing protein n=2 Tax=Lygus hesperus TaxID=30085 RepID=A0A0K8SKW7_LYGHE